jgi:predicted DNA-binding transcriptional regulator YafY
MTFRGVEGAPRLEETKRIARILRMVQLVSAQPRTWTRSALAREFELSERMIDHDLELIRHGLRYDLRRGKSGYYFAQGPISNPIQLTTPEVLALALAAHGARSTGTVDGGVIQSALARLEDALPSAIVPYLRRAAGERPTGVFGPLADRGSRLATLEQAYLERRKVSVSYSSVTRGGASTDRVLAQYYLLPYERSWLSIAHDSLRDEIRMFKVDRMGECRLTDEHYEIPEDFHLSSYLGATWGVLRGEAGPVETVVLWFTARAGAWVRDERWHPSQEIEAGHEGGITMRFHCIITNELVRWVLSFGGDVRIEHPESLRHTVAEQARSVLGAAIGNGAEVDRVTATDGKESRT